MPEVGIPAADAIIMDTDPRISTISKILFNHITNKSYNNLSPSGVSLSIFPPHSILCIGVS